MLIETIILATAPNRVFNSESQLEQIAYAAAWWTICPYCQLEHLEAFLPDGRTIRCGNKRCTVKRMWSLNGNYQKGEVDE